MTVQTVDTLGHAIDGALHWDAIEEHRALAQIEQKMFARARDPVRLSRYLLLRPLGSGGTGVVYDGYDPELARRVAVKVLRAGRKNLESVVRARARFVREAQSIARLSHPNVIAVHDVGTYAPEDLSREARQGLEHGSDDAGVFIVMELVDGHDASTWLERERRGWREVLDVFLAAGQGLAAAHAAGIVHRDFKPGNVLVGEDGRVKVVDFGLAVTYGGSVSESPTGDVDTLTPVPSELASLTSSSAGEDEPPLDKLTRTGTLLGTPAYMAPEQHRGEPADQKADQFAFCASLYRGLYGRHAFAGRQVEALFASKIEGKVRPPPDDSRVPAWVHRVVMRGLATEADDRFASMEELLRMLRADPALRWRRAARLVAIPLAVGALGYAGFVATRPGRVVVSTGAAGRPVPGVQVYVDEHELPGGRGEVAAGLHRVRAVAPAYQPVETVVDVSRGGVHEVALELQHEQGVFDLELEPGGGRVLVDGVDYGSRLTNLRVDTGPHEIVARHVGYVDERLSWDAVAGETKRGFVALRKALAWSRPASGTFLFNTWLGDINGDGLDDLVARRFTTLTAYDPWNDRERWRIVLGLSPFFRTCDVDGDGTLDVVTLRAEKTGVALQAYSGRTQQRRPDPSWSVPLPSVAFDTELEHPPGDLTCIPRAGGGDDLGVVLTSGRVMRAAGGDGSIMWSQMQDEPAVHVLMLEPGSAQPSLVAVGQRGVRAHAADDGHLLWSQPLQVARMDASGEIAPQWHTASERIHNEGQAWAVAADIGFEREDVLVQAAGEGASPYALVALSGIDGHELWRADSAHMVNLAAGRLGDADGDGGLDVLLPRGEGPDTINLVSGRSGRTLWSRPAVRLARMLATAPELLVVEIDGNAVVLVDGATGRQVANTQVPSPLMATAAVYDWDGDARLDVLLGTRDGVLWAFDTRLRRLGTVPLTIPLSRISADRDANHDGFADILLQARGPAVLVGPKVRWERRPLDAIRATPVVADLDGDRQPEVALFGTLASSNRLEILDARTGLVEASSTASETPIVIRPPAVIRAAQGADLLAVGGGIKRYSGRDASLLGSFATRTAYASPTVADLDGDGRDEILMVSWQDPGVLYVIDVETLEARWSRELGPTGSFDAPYVGDVDKDGELDLLIATLGGKVLCLSRDGTPKWEAEIGGRLNHRPTVADLDADGTQEVMVAPQDDTDPLVVLRGTDGVEIARWPGVASRRTRPLASDLDGDGRPEILTSSEDRGLISLAGDGSIRWRYGFADADGLQPAGTASPVLADLDRDGRPELIAGFEDGSLHVVDARDGTLVWRFSIGREEIEASPAVADVDGDGDLEVVIAGHDRQLLCLDHRPGGG